MFHLNKSGGKKKNKKEQHFNPTKTCRHDQKLHHFLISDFIVSVRKALHGSPIAALFFKVSKKKKNQQITLNLEKEDHSPKLTFEGGL